jgi:hypothetical protein
VRSTPRGRSGKWCLSPFSLPEFWNETTLMRFPIAPAACLFAVLLLTAGCEPSVSKKDLGTVIYEVPKVPGADKAFEMPERGAAAGSPAKPAADQR